MFSRLDMMGNFFFAKKMNKLFYRPAILKMNETLCVNINVNI